MRRHSSTSSWTSVLQNRLVALVMLMTVAVPFLATPSDGGVSAGGQAFVVFGILLLATLLWRARWNFGGENLLSFLRTGSNLPVLLLLGLGALSCAFSPHKDYSLHELFRLGAGIMLYFVAAYHIRRAEQLTKMVDILVFVAIGASLIGFVEYGMQNEQTYATGFLGDHQLYGSFMMILLPIVSIVALTEKVPNRQLLAQIGTVMTIAALLLSHSRSAWIGGSVGMGTLALLAIFTATRKRVSGRKQDMVMPVMLLVVAVGFFMLISPQASSILDRAGTLSQVQTDRGWQYRQQAARGALDMVKERPIAGFGIGLYPYYQQQYTHSGVPIYLLKGAHPSLGEQAHNVYLQTAAELGIPGLLALLAILTCFLGFGLLKVGSMDVGIRRTILIGAIGSIAAFAVDAFGSPAWQLGQVSMFFWLILGLGVGSLRPRYKHIQNEETLPQAAPSKASRFSGVLASIGLAALIPMTAIAACPPNYLIPKSANITPKDLTITQAPGQQKTQDFTLTVTFTDNEVFDVTLCPGTNFDQAGGDGILIGVNNHTYQTAPNEFDDLTITGTFTQQSTTVSDSTPLHVRTQ
jgi:putative inorganic carbon (HCO3(-)) transporter